MINNVRFYEPISPKQPPIVRAAPYVRLITRVLQSKYSVKMCATVTAGKMLAKPYQEP